MGRMRGEERSEEGRALGWWFTTISQRGEGERRVG